MVEEKQNKLLAVAKLANNKKVLQTLSSLAPTAAGPPGALSPGGSPPACAFATPGVSRMQAGFKASMSSTRGSRTSSTLSPPDPPLAPLASATRATCGRAAAHAAHSTRAPLPLAEDILAQLAKAPDASTPVVPLNGNGKDDAGGAVPVEASGGANMPASNQQMYSGVARRARELREAGIEVDTSSTQGRGGIVRSVTSGMSVLPFQVFGGASRAGAGRTRRPQRGRQVTPSS